MIRRFIRYYHPVRRMFFLDMLCSFFVAAIDMAYPLINRHFVRDVIPNKEIRALVIVCLVLLVLFTIKMFLKYYVQYQGHLVGTKMQANMRDEVFCHLQTLPFSYFDENKTGTIMSRIINDLFDISELAHHGPEDLFISLLTLLGSFIILSFINLPLTLIVFAIVPFLLVFAMKKRKRLSKTMAATRVEVGEVNAALESSIGGIRVSKAFNTGRFEEEKFQQNNLRFLDARSEAYKAMAEFYSGTYYITDLLSLIAIGASGLFAVQGLITIADFFAYVLYISMFTDPIKRLINFVEQFQSGATGFARFCELMDEPSEWEKSDALPVSAVKGSIVFQDVSFSYDKGKEVFSQISFTIEPGQTVGFVGPSGEGKTTLCHLIPRFYDVSHGQITLDGRDITTILRSSLRDQIGIVQQDTYLFGGTIRQNIAYGNLAAGEDDIREAAKRANIHDYIMSLPDGYDTQVGERGIKLSGGQKQRISIARVFLKNPPILILDEATSALDNTTELLIQESLDELCQGRTTLVVAHRLSTIRHADNIFVITQKGVAESGTHEELIKKGGFYADLYRAQFRSAE